MENICSLSSAASSGAVFILAFPATPSGRWPRAGSKTFGGGCNGSFQAALTWGRARLFLFSIRQHFVDACDDLPRVLDRSLALPDLVQEALTFFFAFSISAAEELNDTIFCSFIAQPQIRRGLRSSGGKRRYAAKHVKSDLQQSVPTGREVTNFVVNARGGPPTRENSPRPASTPGRYKPATSSTQSVIRSWHPIGSGIFVGIAGWLTQPMHFRLGPALFSGKSYSFIKIKQCVGRVFGYGLIEYLPGFIVLLQFLE